MTLGLSLPAAALATSLMLGSVAVGFGGCAETASGEPRVRVVKNKETAAEVGGIPPDKQADIQLVLQQREPSVRKCYNDVLNDGSHDRTFKGTVQVLLTIEPSGKASAKVIGGSLDNAEVNGCLVEKLADFEYPEIPNQGTMQYVYKFEPAY
jgi:hypothetical protein